MADKPQRDRVYQNLFMDSTRWEGFEPRDGDVLVCTSYKAGTTWTQMICALIIHQDPKLPKPLSELSPWMEIRLSPIAEVQANYRTQSHRRFIKTHTPLDGLPYWEGATYLVCGRDPRDVFMSMQHHMGNIDMMRFATLLAEQGVAVEPPPPAPDDYNERFKAWMTVGGFPWEEDGFPQWSHFRHAQTFWDHRDLPNIHFLHYADLKADLEGQMRRVAKILDVEVPEAKWPELVKAATFSEMKANADRNAPNTDHAIWTSNAEFFHKGSHEQWKGVLSEESVALYEDAKRKRYDPTFVAWLEQGSAMTGDPKTL